MMKKALLVALCLVCLLLTGCGKNETAAVPTDANDRPKKEQKIKYIRFAD